MSYTITKVLLFFVLIATILFGSCKKEDPETIAIAAISVYNTSPTVLTYDAFLDGTKINSVALPYAGGVKYQQTAAGSRILNFNIANGTSSEVSKSVNLVENTYTTVYLIGKTGSFDVLAVKDELGQTFVEGKAFVRFINLSPDAPTLDLNLTAGAAVATNKTYKTNSDFVLVSAGSVTFEVKETVSSALKATITETLTAGKFYTVIAGGMITPANANERGLNAQIMVHQ